MDEHVASLSDFIEDADIIEWEDTVVNIKHDINNMIWMNMPDNTTLKEADILSIEILDTFFNKWEEVTLRRKQKNNE